MPEFLRISRATLLLTDFLPKALTLFNRMIKQGGNKHQILRHFDKFYFRHNSEFQKYNITLDDLKQHFV